MRTSLTWLCSLSLLSGVACGGDGDADEDLPFGDTAVVVVVNPPENAGTHGFAAGRGR